MRALKLRATLSQQPRHSVYPEGTSPNSLEIDMFGIFRTETIDSISGMFNKRFWSVDVPRAAQIHPALWHASLAMAAIHQTEKIKENTKRITNTIAIKQHKYYVFALSHFNESLVSLKKSLTYDINSTTISYQRQELVLLTNLLYIGICNMLGESKQAISHIKNLLYFIDHVRFGQDCNANPQGAMLNYNELLSVLLFLDGTTINYADIKPRADRPYVIAVPERSSFRSISDAYLAFQLLVSNSLHRVDMSVLQQKEHFALAIEINQSFRLRLSEFEKTNNLSNSEYRDIRIMDVFLRYSEARYSTIVSTTISERVEHIRSYDRILDEIDAILEQQQSQQQSQTTSPIMVSFSPNLRALTSKIASSADVKTVHRKALMMLKKWPFKQSASSSDLDHAVFSAKVVFDATGPARSLPWQRKGFPVELIYCKDGSIDPYESCECITETFVCQDHRMASHHLTMGDGRASIKLRNVYETRNNLEGQTYELTW